MYLKMANESSYEYLPRPDNASSMSPSDARALFRRNGYYGTTAGFCLGHAQTNVVILPKQFSDDFEEFCKRNSGPLPLLYRSGAGEVGAPPLATDSNIRTDLPRYFIYSKGHIVEDTLDLSGFDSMWDNYVSFYIGCSFTFDTALLENGIELEHTVKGKNISLYSSNIALYSVGPFEGKMTVSLRMFTISQLEKAFMISSQYPDHHGAPVHIGDPSRIGIDDIMKPDMGDLPVTRDGDIPVFWACGVTAREAIFSAKPQLAFSQHDPTSTMYIADIKLSPTMLDDTVEVVQLSRPTAPYFASVIDRKSLPTFEALELALLDDPGKRGVAHLFQKSDLLKATLALSHSRSVAVMTGFPACTESKIKEETDGLPGALAVCQALVTLGKEVTLVVDEGREKLYTSCVELVVEVGALQAGSVAVIPFKEAKKKMKDAPSSSPPVYDCLVAIERAGQNSHGSYCTVKGKDVSQYVEPIDELFEVAQRNPHITTVGVGNGGNELGIGKVYDSVVKNIPLGETIACCVSADFLIAAGVSNWGGYALACGLYVGSSSPFHWRHRNHTINADQPPQFDVHRFLPTAEQTSSLLKHMNEVGFCDRVSHGLGLSVDGLPLKVHLDKLAAITELATSV